MKKIFLLLSIVLVGNMLINSCIYDKVCESESSIIVNPIDTSQNSSKNIYFIRLVLESMTGSKPMAMDWSIYKNVGFFINTDNDSTIYLNKKLESTEDSGNRTILLLDSISTSRNNCFGFCYSPYQPISSQILNSNLNSNQSQTIVGSGEMDASISSNMMLYASPVAFKAMEEGTCELHLKNLFSLIRLTISKEASLVMNNRSISNIKLYIANKSNVEQPINDYALAGLYTMDLSDNLAKPKFTVPYYSINSSINSQVTLENNPIAYFVVNPFTLKANECLVAKIETNRSDIIYSTFDINTVVSNNVYDITATATQTNTYVETIKEDYLNTISNCYIISEKGKYIFPAKNNSGPLLGSDVDWLWASIEGGNQPFSITDLIDTSSIIYNGSSIIFQIGSNNPFSKFTKGNVILALKDASGNIVWTWHIWITDKPEDMVYDNGSAFMDRNLGALSADINSPAVDTYGFVYQWGRKDPFFGGDGVTYDEAEGAFSTARAHTIINNSAGTWNTDVDKWTYKAGSPTTGFLDYIKQYPMQFIYNQGSGPSWKKAPADWLFTSNSSLWSPTLKTDYDPCPNGYRVPSANEIYILQAANVTGAFNQYSEKYWKYNSSIVSYWPAAGMRQGRQNISSGIYGTQLKYSATDMLEGQCYYWTSTPFSVGGTIVSGASYRIHTVSDKLYSDDDYGDNADAYPIRCVRE